MQIFTWSNNIYQLTNCLLRLLCLPIDENTEAIWPVASVIRLPQSLAKILVSLDQPPKQSTTSETNQYWAIIVL